MNGSQILLLALVTALLGLALWVVLVSIPSYFETILTDKLRDQRTQHRRWMATKRHLQNNDALLDIDAFLTASLCQPWAFDLPSALAVQRGLSRLAPDDDIDAPGLERLNRDQRDQIGDMVARSLRLVFYRSFLSSPLWFVVWPGVFWARRRFVFERKLPPAKSKANMREAVIEPLALVVVTGASHTATAFGEHRNHERAAV